MLAINANDRTATHIDAITYVKRVPNKRETEDAYARIVATLSIEQAEALGEDIELVRDFICSL